MIENNFQQRYSSAPQNIKDFLISEELTETTKNIVALTKLDANQTTELTEMIGKVLIGQISPENFCQKIESNLKLSPAQARIIIELAKKKIFEQFSKELEQYKSQSLEQRIPQKIKTEKPVDSSKSPNIESIKQERFPDYSFPEPSEVKVEKPINKIQKLKKIVKPKVSLEQQEQIRQELLKAMQKKDTQPKIVEEMKKISLKKPISKDTKQEEKEPQRKKIIEKVIPSEILGGEGKKFQAEKGLSESKEEKPYIFDVKLKEEPYITKAMEDEQKERNIFQEKPIRYKKYQKKNPFGEA